MNSDLKFTSSFLISLVLTTACFGQISSVKRVNKKFLVKLHVTKDQAGIPCVDAARLVEIKAAISGASAPYAPIGISFEVSDNVNYIDNYQLNVISTEVELEELSSKYDFENRLNVYLFSLFDEELEGGCGIAGQIGAENKFLYMSQSCVNTGSFAHEAGHFFGLPHTFDGSPTKDDLSLELVDGSNCDTEGDGICDTPADPYVKDSTEPITYIEDCAYVYNAQDANGAYYDPDIGNIMSYYFEGCACGLHFTEGQFKKMSDTYYGAVGVPPGTGTICIW